MDYLRKLGLFVATVLVCAILETGAVFPPLAGRGHIHSTPNYPYDSPLYAGIFGGGASIPGRYPGGYSGGYSGGYPGAIPAIASIPSIPSPSIPAYPYPGGNILGYPSIPRVHSGYPNFYSGPPSMYSGSPYDYDY